MSLIVVNTYQDRITKCIDQALIKLLNTHEGPFEPHELTIIVPYCVSKAMEPGQELKGNYRLQQIFGIKVLVAERNDIVIRTKNRIIARKAIPAIVKKDYS
jgi:hypothetical protein